MVIRRMINTRNPGELREFQTRMTTVGKIRLGVYNGRYPEKIDTFRFTSADEQLIRAVAGAYGGTPEQWTPQGSRTPQWEVISEANAVPVFVVNGQTLEPWYEAWASGRTCIRRCDGITNRITDEDCLCNGPDAPTDPRQLCKPTIRVQVMLPEVPGIGSWLLESHGENACSEIATPGPLVASAPMPIPAVLRLRPETRREWNHEERKFDTKSFFVPWLDISAITAQQVAIGGDALTTALRAAGAPAALAGGDTRMALAAAAATEPAPEPEPPVFVLTPDEKARLLGVIEDAPTVARLDGIRAKMIERGVTDPDIKAAWKSKKAAIVAADRLHGTADRIEAGEEEFNNASGTGRPYRVLVTGSRTWTNVEELEKQLSFALTTHRGRMVLVHGACPSGADAIADRWARRNDVPVEAYPADWDGQGKSAGFIRNGIMVNTRPDIVLSFNRMNSRGTEHCTAAAEYAGLKVLRFTDDTPVELFDADLTHARQRLVDAGAAAFPGEEGLYTEALQRDATPEAIVEAGGPAHWLAGDDQARGMHEVHDAEIVEDTPNALPDVPDGEYDPDDVYASLMTGASRQDPPLTTGELNALILRTFGAPHVEFVGGYELARLRAGLKAGTVRWR